MVLQPQDIEVGCIFRPRREVGAPCTGRGPHIIGLVPTGVPCQWSPSRGRKINPDLECLDGCKLTTKGQKHPIIVIRIDGNDISYVQMTGTPIKNEKRGTVYSPIGHYFPAEQTAEITHPEEYPSRYWLRVENFSETTLDEARSKRGFGRTIELTEYCMLRLPHIFTQPLSKFELMGGCNSTAMDYCLDRPSYYRLMDRLGLSSGNDRSDIVEPGTQNNSIFPGIFSQLFSYLSVYNSTEDDPVQSQAELIYPGDELELSVLQKSSRLECVWSWLGLDRLLRN